MKQMQDVLEPKTFHDARVVYFATGTAQEVADDFRRLRLTGNGTRLRVVAPAAVARQLTQLAPLKPGELLPYYPGTALLLWVRLLGFLRFAPRAEILCLTSKERYRFLKCLALTLRGRVVFRHPAGDGAQLTLASLIRLWLRQRWDAREERRKPFPVGVVGSGSPESLRRIVARLRQLYPQARIHGLLPPDLAPATAECFDSVHVLRRGFFRLSFETIHLFRSARTYQRWIVPCTGEPYGLLKAWAFLWPLRRRQIYNEFGDGFAAWRVHTLWEHLRWRRRRSREARLALLPVGVLGSASGYYLEKIMSVIRAQYPGVHVHGCLRRTATPATAALFDAVTRLRPGIWGGLSDAWMLWKRRNRYRLWVVPCSNEPYAALKFMAFVWPLRRRQIYNEQGDGFAARNLGMFWKHFRWRLRDRMSFQILAGAAGNNAFSRLAHLALYCLRILGAVPLLVLARTRYLRNRWVPSRSARKSEAIGRNEAFKARNKRLAGGGMVVPRLPGEPDGSVGLE